MIFKYGHFKSRLDEYKYEKDIVYKPPKHIVRVPFEIITETADAGFKLDATWDDI